MYCIVDATTNVSLPKVVNSVGKYLYRKLDGSYSFKKTSNTAEVKSTILYQIPKEVSDRYNLDKDVRDEVKVMDITIDVTTYADKIRVNVIEVTPEEKTIGFKTFKSSIFQDMPTGLLNVYGFVTSSIEREFYGYTVLF